MNRVWSDAVLATAQSCESRRALELLPFVREADWMLDLHSMHERSAPLSLTGLQRRHLTFGLSLGAPAYLVVDAGHHNGTRMRDYGDFGRDEDTRTRALLIECGLHTDPASVVVARDLVVRFLRRAGSVDAVQLEGLERTWRQPDAQDQWILTVTEAVVASNAQFRFARRYAGLEVIAKAGTVIGWNDGEPVTTPYPDCVLVMPSTRQAAPGVTVVRFATRAPAPALP